MWGNSYLILKQVSNNERFSPNLSLPINGIQCQAKIKGNLVNKLTQIHDVISAYCTVVHYNICKQIKFNNVNNNIKMLFFFIFFFKLTKTKLKKYILKWLNKIIKETLKFCIMHQFSDMAMGAISSLE